MAASVQAGVLKRWNPKGEVRYNVPHSGRGVVALPSEDESVTRIPQLPQDGESDRRPDEEVQSRRSASLPNVLQGRGRVDAKQQPNTPRASITSLRSKSQLIFTGRKSSISVIYEVLMGWSSVHVSDLL